MIYTTIVKYYKKLLKMPLFKLLLINYALVWLGILTSLLIGKIIYLLYPHATVSLNNFANMRMNVIEDVSGTIVPKTENPLLFIALTYFLNNFLCALIIIVVFLLQGLWIKNEKEYYDSCITFYIICVLMPLSGLIGGWLPLKGIYAIIPHGIFELLGVAFAITVGMKYSYKIHNKEKVNYLSLTLMVLTVAFLLLTAGLLEPLDWALYIYAKMNNQSLPEILVKFYLGL